ncbi:hypothetical protein ACFORL_05100 [Legionella dresdenensis]|uniref:Uncharacterized protein n=1 Tax=Legionella dresdenensis TaxID=450200 RepID=A0ABV8CER9_9GAMM
MIQSLDHDAGLEPISSIFHNVDAARRNLAWNINNFRSHDHGINSNELLAILKKRTNLLG